MKKIPLIAVFFAIIILYAQACSKTANPVVPASSPTVVPSPTSTPGCKKWEKTEISPAAAAIKDSVSVVFQSKIITLGGTGKNAGPVWVMPGSPDDPAEDNYLWVTITPEAQFGKRKGFAAAVFKKELWVTCGESEDGSHYNDAWSSAEGVTWTAVSEEAEFFKRSGHCAVVYNERIWIIGGGDKSNCFNDIWSSGDGKGWEQRKKNDEEGFGRRKDFSAIVFNGRMWVIGGTDGKKVFNDIWSSSNGTDWEQVTLSAKFGARHSFNIALYKQRLWIAGGMGPGGKKYNDVWSSTDAILWEEVSDKAEFPPVYGHSLAAGFGKLYLIGGVTEKGMMKEMWVTR